MSSAVSPVRRPLGRRVTQLVRRVHLFTGLFLWLTVQRLDLERN